MPQAIEAMRAAFGALGRGEVTMPQRLATPIDEHDATHLTMPCHVGGDDPFLCLKVVTFFPENAKRGEPTVRAVIVVSDPATGAPVALMDGEHVTAVRTGAVSGLATEYLSRKTSKTLGVFGTGEIAYWQVAAVCAVRPVQRVLVGARDVEKGERFCSRVSSDFGVECTFEPSPRLIAPECDVICLATTSREPVLLGKDVMPWTHVNGVGSFRADMHETDLGFVENARVVVDLSSAARVGAGELIQAAGAGVFDWGGAIELSQLVLGNTPGRLGQEVTYFKSVGLAVQDAFCSRLVLARAREQRLGTCVSLD
jgi:ornithine cyclodeaminase/alanine dehydrogenase-like protein (mu-crystallin family)